MAKSVSKRDRKIFDWIVERARQSEPCPTNDEIANRCGLLASGSAAQLMKRLDRAGLISVVRYARYRIVTIVGEGIKTTRPTEASRGSQLKRTKPISTSDDDGPLTKKERKAALSGSLKRPAWEKGRSQITWSEYERKKATDD